MPSTKEEAGYEPVPLKDLNGKAEEGKAAEAGEGTGLKPKLNLINGCTIIVGSIIGSGIFVSPTGVLKSTGSVNLSLVVWLSCGVFSAIGAYCYAELGCMIKKSGADYAYIMVTFGNFVAFIRLWVECMIVRPCCAAIVALTFAKYATKPFFPECEPPDETVRMLAALCICGIAFINCWEVKWATFVQDIFTYAKLLALFIIIMTGFVQLGRGKTENFTWENTETDPMTIALSFYSGLFAYNGWNYLNFIIEELQDPVRNLPRAIGISIVLVTVVYFMTNVAFFTTLNTFEALGSEAVAMTFANRLYGPAAWVMAIFVSMSCFGGVNGILMTSSRLFYSGAMEGQMPGSLSMINVQKSTPVPAIIAIALISLAYLTSSNVFALINYVGFGTWVSIGLAVFCIPWLRWKHPEWERPIKVNMAFPVIYIIATVVITVLPMAVDPLGTAIGLLLILTAIPVYFLFVYWKNKPAVIENMSRGITLFIQKLTIVVPPSKSD